MRIETLDLVIIVAYLVGIVALGLLASRHEKNTTSDYFLAGRSLRWPMIGLALFATNISTVHLVGAGIVGVQGWTGLRKLRMAGHVLSDFTGNRICALLLSKSSGDAT